jgi:hypothetical protein
MQRASEIEVRAENIAKNRMWDKLLRWEKTHSAEEGLLTPCVCVKVNKIISSLTLLDTEKKPMTFIGSCTFDEALKTLEGEV